MGHPIPIQTGVVITAVPDELCRPFPTSRDKSRLVCRGCNAFVGASPHAGLYRPFGAGEGMSYRKLLLFFKIACIFHQKAVPLQRSGLVGVHILLEAL